jgi:hypothetical protein
MKPRKGIKRFRTLKQELKHFKNLNSTLYQESLSMKNSILYQKIHIGALRDFILRCYQESHEIDITHSKQYLLYLTHVLHLDIKIPHDGPVTILAPAQYVFWQRQKMSDNFRNLSNQVNNFGCNFIPTNEDQI